MLNDLVWSSSWAKECAVKALSHATTHMMLSSCPVDCLGLPDYGLQQCISLSPAVLQLQAAMQPALTIFCNTFCNMPRTHCWKLQRQQPTTSFCSDVWEVSSLGHLPMFTCLLPQPSLGCWLSLACRPEHAACRWLFGSHQLCKIEAAGAASRWPGPQHFLTSEDCSSSCLRHRSTMLLHADSRLLRASCSVGWRFHLSRKFHYPQFLDSLQKPRQQSAGHTTVLQ